MSLLRNGELFVLVSGGHRQHVRAGGNWESA